MKSNQIISNQIISNQIIWNQIIYIQISVKTYKPKQTSQNIVYDMRQCIATWIEDIFLLCLCKRKRPGIEILWSIEKIKSFDKYIVLDICFYFFVKGDTTFNCSVY